MKKLNENEQENIPILLLGKKLIEFQDKKVHLIMPKLYDAEFEEILLMHMRAQELKEKDKQP